MTRAGLILTLLVGTPATWAQSTAAAEALFQEGRRLAADGKIAEACAKFEASYHTVPALGVRLNLARCWRQLGRTASAWAEYRGAAEMAARAHDPRENEARQRAEELAPLVAHLTVK